MKSRDGNQDDKDNLGTRESLDNLSQASQIPLDPIIKKTTSVHISTAQTQKFEGPRNMLSRWEYYGKSDEITQSQWI